MRVVSKKALQVLWIKHPDAKQRLESWYREAKAAYWTSPGAIKEAYPSASILEDNRVVFNIKGNHFRLIVKINYNHGMVWIRFVGIHAEYDRIDATKL